MGRGSETGAGRLGVVFVHGIVGNNRIFDFLRDELPSDCERVDVVLAGHGGDALDFSRASMDQWLRQAEEAIATLRGRCDRVVAAAHSMGCLLVMEAAAKGDVAGLFLMNPPLRIRLRLRLLTNALKVAVGKTGGDPVASAAETAYGVGLDFNPLHYYGWPRRYGELFKEIRRVRSSVVERIECPVRAFLTAGDEMVAPSSAAVLERSLQAVTTVLPHSTHYYYSPEDREKIKESFRQFVREISAINAGAGGTAADKS